MAARFLYSLNNKNKDTVCLELTSKTVSTTIGPSEVP